MAPKTEASTTLPAMGSSEVLSDVGDCFLSEWDLAPLWPPDLCPGGGGHTRVR